MSDTKKSEGSLPSELVVLTYTDGDTAARAREALYAMAGEHFIEVEDALVVTREGNGRVHLHPVLGLSALHWAQKNARVTVTAGIAGMFFGGLVGALAGLGVGAVGSTLAHHKGRDYGSDYGVPDRFVKEVGASLQPGGSALLILFHDAVVDRVIPELAHFGGTVFRTGLSPAFTDRLNAALAAAPPSPSEASGTEPTG